MAVLPDPHDLRGRRHALASVLLTAACAVLAGARSYLAIGQWAHRRRRTPSPAWGFMRADPSGCAVRPRCSTVRRVLLGVCHGGLADLLGDGPAGTESVAVDGKTARGSRTDTVPPTCCPPSRPPTAP
ncbi:transposase family protein [Streptomyces sp. H27-H1]|uniref:transposase family protein n=1 Tax=Streptomyces sp. H27-H1 TaxID=2996461 RepID=UPI003B63D28F